MRKRPSPLRALIALSLGVLALAVSIVGYRLLRAQVAASVYRERLEEVARAYDALRSRYNEAVRRTAVTELVVRDGRLSVRVRNAAGLIREIPTPYDPSGEIYVDFVALDGRLYIRRVFDARTPPSEGLTIDGSLAQIDWDAPGADHGKAIYRRLGEGRWVISATGNGRSGPPQRRELGRAALHCAMSVLRQPTARGPRRHGGGKPFSAISR